VPRNQHLRWDSNPRSPPCKVRSIMSWLFTGVHKCLQTSIFFLRSCRPCSSLFVWVSVLIGVRNGCLRSIKSIYRDSLYKPPSSTRTLSLVHPLAPPQPPRWLCPPALLARSTYAVD
jgi:hypothetical protein